MLKFFAIKEPQECLWQEPRECIKRSQDFSTLLQQRGPLLEPPISHVPLKASVSLTSNIEGSMPELGQLICCKRL